IPCSLFFFFQAEDGIRDRNVTGVQTCALPIFGGKLYSIGGFTIARPAGGGLPAWVPSNSVWIYDTAANAWSKGTPVPTPRGALRSEERRVGKEGRGGRGGSH